MIKLTELSRKNLLNLLLNGQGKKGVKNYIEPSKFLAEWTRDFYARLIFYNPGYEVFSRGVDDRRFDALARLLVGNETCAAVGFNGTNILIATNQAHHEEKKIHYQIDFSLIGDNDFNQGIVIQPILRLFYNNQFIVQLDGNVVQYQYDHINGLYYNISLTDLNFYIDSVDHGIPSLPSINIPFSLKSIIPAPPQINPEDFINLISNGYIVNGINKNVSIEPLARRIDKLFFLPLRLLAKIILERREDKLYEFETSSNMVEWLESFLHDSLVWETATWYRNENINPRNFADNNMTIIRQFVTLLNEDYIKFKEKNDILIPATKAVKLWASIVIAKILTGDLVAPLFIASNPAFFMERALRYFEDIDKLLDFVKNDALENRNFAKMLASEVIVYPPKPSKIPVIIKDSLPEGTHAELRVLWESIKNTKTLKYIATSKLCCPLCNLIFKTFGIEHITNLDGENHSGGHGKIYPWILPDEFYNDNDFMIAFLGEDLFASLLSMDGKNVKLHSVNYTTIELIKLIIESLGRFNEEDLEALGIRVKIGELLGNHYSGALKLFYNEGDLPYESDDEGVPHSYSSNPAAINKFIKHTIQGDGNCMFNAILKGVSLLGNDAPEDHMALRVKIQEHMRTFPERFNEAINHAILDMVMAGDMRGVSDANFIGILMHLLNLKRTLQSANTPIHEIRENILHAVQGMNLAEHYIDLIDRDGFWGGEAELGAASEILELSFLVYRNNRVIPINNAGNEVQVVHLRFNGGHYDVLTENPIFNRNSERSIFSFEEEFTIDDNKEVKLDEEKLESLRVLDNNITISGGDRHVISDLLDELCNRVSTQINESLNQIVNSRLQNVASDSLEDDENQYIDLCVPDGVFLGSSSPVEHIEHNY